MNKQNIFISLVPKENLSISKSTYFGWLQFRVLIVNPRMFFLVGKLIKSCSSLCLIRAFVNIIGSDLDLWALHCVTLAVTFSY